MPNLSLPYAEDLLIISGKSPQALEAEYFYWQSNCSSYAGCLSGFAAEFCHMNKLQFMYEIGRLQVPVINLDDDQILYFLRSPMTEN